MVILKDMPQVASGIANTDKHGFIFTSKASSPTGTSELGCERVEGGMVIFP